MANIVIPKRPAIILAGDLGMFKIIKSTFQLLISQPYCVEDSTNFEFPFLLFLVKIVVAIILIHFQPQQRSEMWTTMKMRLLS